MREIIDAAALREMLLCANAALEENKQRINELNVFPVPDGDTGTNMSLTMNSAAIELGRKQTDTVGAVADCAASALLRGARGNSGVILSLLFRGIAKSLKGRENANAAEFAAAVSAGVDAAYKAVMKPAEGTILTVSRLAAERAVNAAEERNSVEYVIEQAIAQGEITLAQTTDMNPVLKKAGVVDAGGKGFLLILGGMLSALRGEERPELTAEDTQEKADFAMLSEEDITFTFDTVFIVRKSGRSIEPFRRFLDGIGDSLVIGEDDEAFKVHVHTNIPGDALSEAQKYGTLELAKIENMRLQHTEKVLSVCTIETGENLFLADTDKAAQQLQQALPYVYSAKIKRKLPGTVQIQVTDAAPAYAVKNKDKTYTLMDDRFKVLEVVQKKPKESILIQKANLNSAKVGQTAQFANKNVAACLTQLAQAIRDYQFTEATAICSEGLNSNSIVYDGRIVFKLGTCEKLEKKIHQGLAACAQLDQDNPSVKGTLRLTGEKQYYFTED